MFVTPGARATNRLYAPWFTKLIAGRFVKRWHRNRRIGEFLKELSLTDGRGTGITKVLKAMRLNGSPPPVFKTKQKQNPLPRALAPSSRVYQRSPGT